jgi:glyoxalase family protein
MTTTVLNAAHERVARPTVGGLHHVTAITGDAQANADFYTLALGLRMVKVTINYDDPGSYHLYYGDGLGRPGTILTFFVWPGARRGRAGTGQVSETAFAIPAGAAGYWRERLTGLGVREVAETVRFGVPAVTLVDPDGMALALVESSVDATYYWAHGAVPAEKAIHGFYGVTLAETSAALPAAVLVERFGYRETARQNNRVRYALEGAAVAGVVDVVVLGERSLPAMGAGQVHHVAFATPDDGQQAVWLEQLRKGGFNVSPVMDRNYFHSIYFREPGGTLFEIATAGPGMTFNESAGELGSHLMLPPWLEGSREEVVKVLPALKLAPRVEMES